MKYYLSADWVNRSDELEELFEDSLKKEECVYEFNVLEDYFYKIKDNPKSVFYKDSQKEGGVFGVKTVDIEGQSYISWKRKGFRYIVEFKTLKELEEFREALDYPDILIGSPDVLSCGENWSGDIDGCITILGNQCENCGGFQIGRGTCEDE